MAAKRQNPVWTCRFIVICLSCKGKVGRSASRSPAPFPVSKENMKNRTYDFLVLGGGSAGYAAARTAHDLGLSTAVVDGAAELGGLCILRGCMPSKTLIESSNRYRSMRRASEFGLRSGNTEVHIDEIIARKRHLIGEFAEYRQGQLTDGRFDLHRGRGIFSGTHSVTVRPLDGSPDYELKFRSGFIATGSRISHVPIPGLEEVGYWTSDDVLDAEAVPESILVLGGGAIALEMACYFEGLGKEVSVIQRSGQLLSGADPDIAAALEQALTQRENLQVYTGTSLQSASLNPETGKKQITFEQGNQSVTLDCDQILVALGRVPNSGGLHLSAAGVELEGESGQVKTDSRQRTTADAIFAGGDVCGPHEIVHIAIEQGEIAATNAAILLGKLDQAERFIDYRLKLLGIFTDPEVAMVGYSESEAEAAGIEIAKASASFDDHGKSMVRGERHGFVKMIVDVANGKLIGASAVGPEAVEIIHEVVVAMHFHATAAEFLKIPHYHPTLSEIWTYPAEDLSIYG